MDPLLRLFNNPKPLIACIHLHALPGAPSYSGNFDNVLEKALLETRIFMKHGIDGLIVENFRDVPFYPDQLPAETISSLAVVTRLVKSAFVGPVGVNALRNDAIAALSAAHAAGADFIRVNVHSGAAITDQGIVQGKAHNTLRLRKTLGTNIAIIADVRVKHASPLGNTSLDQEIRDNVERGMADGVILSGTATGSKVDLNELKEARQVTQKPIFIGSGANPDNLRELGEFADGFIVGSYFKRDGNARNEVEEAKVKEFVRHYNHHYKR